MLTPLSAREGRLWKGALLTLLAIYSTLALARRVVDFLRERDLLAISVWSTFALAAVALVVVVVRRRPGPREMVVLAGFGAIYALLLQAMERAEERLHLLEYGLLGLFIYLALVERKRHTAKWTWPRPALLAAFLTGLCGWGDEIIQGILPSRYYDLRDVAWNTIAGCLAIAATVLLGGARRRSGR